MKRIVLLAMVGAAQLSATVETRAQYSVVHYFVGGPDDGASPGNGSSLVATGSTLYGMTNQGGSQSNGVLFKIDVSGSGLQIVHNFDSSDRLSIFNYGSPVLAGSSLYGMTPGVNAATGAGTIFRVETDGSAFQVLHSFGPLTSDGANPQGSLILDGSTLYGMTETGGATLGGVGTVFKIETNGATYQILYTFKGQAFGDGASPLGSPVLAGSTLYGMTSGGGTTSYGTVFSVNTDGSGYQILHTFLGGGTEGAAPSGALVVSGSTLYGMTPAVTASTGYGTVFQIETNGTGFQVLHRFGSTDAGYPYGDLALSGSKLYGMASWDPNFGDGVVFQINTDGSGYHIIHTFAGSVANNESVPVGTPLLLGSKLYGMTQFGGPAGPLNPSGCIFQLDLSGSGNGIVTCALSPAFAINPVGTSHTVTAAVSSNGVARNGVLVQFDIASGPNFGQSGTATTSFGLGTFTYVGSGGLGTDTIQAVSLNATGTATKVWIAADTNQVPCISVTPTTLHSFAKGDGADPEAALVDDGSGNFYGTTQQGGNTNLNSGVGFGTVFRIDSDGSLTTLYSFSGADDGGYPNGLTRGNDGSFYGTAQLGGAGGRGTVYRVNSSGTLTTLHSFNGVDGDQPWAELVQGSDGDLYGSTANLGPGGNGTVFRITTDGTLTTLHSFNLTDGWAPRARLLEWSDGHFYGTTWQGGNTNASATGRGTVFEITSSGSFTNLHSFNGTDGAYPLAGLTRGNNGFFYGTTSGFPETDGTVFRISSDGSFSNLHSFSAIVDGAEPRGNLIQDSSGSLYGTTSQGGVGLGDGTLFIITQGDNIFTPFTFGGFVTDAAIPLAGVSVASNGVLYGTTSLGGSSTNCQGGCGTVFKLVISTGQCDSLSCTLVPPLATNTVGISHTVIATVTSNGVARSGASVQFSVISGPNAGADATKSTSISGTASFTYTGTGGVGTDTIRAISLGATGTATKVWVSAACTYTLSATSVTLTAKGGTKSVRVKASGSGCSWIAASNDPFITITGSTATMVKFSVPGNTNTTTLTGTITIGDQTFTVNQAAGGCTYKLSPKTAKFKAAGGAKTVRVNPNLSDCDWTAVSNDSFITITGGTNGVGKGTVSYNVAPNVTTNVLIGTMTIAGQTYSVTQSGSK